MKVNRFHHPCATVLRQRCLQADTLHTFLNTNYVPHIIIMFIFIMHIELSYSQIALNREWPIRVLEGARELTHCEGLGYPNATKNDCGYCTLGNTTLALNYGKDCKGICGGSNIIDCSGVCGGKSYIDECSGECIGGSTGIKEPQLTNARDCRGYCLVSGGQFFSDSCNVCHKGTSPFEDCTNKCHLPGKENMMAKLVCRRCVGGTSQVSESDVLDACGNCRSEGKDCICNGTGSPDPCGVCNGLGRSCMRVLSFFPQAAPDKTVFDLSVKGAFRGRQQNLKCLLTSVLDNEELGLQVDFPGTSNGTHLRCRVNLTAGKYRVGARIEIGETPDADHVEDSELLIYENAEYEEMSPSIAVFDREPSQEVILTFSKGRLPNIPLTCIVNGEGWPSRLRLARSIANSLHTCVIPYANSSVKLRVSPSLNGIHPFRKSFPFTFYASPPEMKKYFIAEDGHAVVIVFDRPVNVCKLKKCSDMLNNDTIARLGLNATCKWATKQQLVINVQRPISGNPIRITFKRGVLMQDDQQFANAKSDTLTIDAWYPQPSSSAQVAISGPTTLPFCGTFTLVGHFSSPKGDAEFYWTANRGDQQKLEEQIANALLLQRTASLILSTSLLQVDMDYIFILTAQHSENEKYEARRTVMRKSYIGPLVSAYSNVMAQPSISVNQAVTLQADWSVPNCGSEIENVQILWTVDNPKVKFDFGSRHLQIYEIKPYTLPENSIITFSAMAYFGGLLNVTESRVTLRVEPLILKAKIKGGGKRVVGTSGGSLILESDNINGKLPLVYQWRCFDAVTEICYNYNPEATRALLITREKQKEPNLNIPLENLKAGQSLTFELQVFNANNRYQSSAAASVQVAVENGSIPQVIIRSVVAEGLDPIERHPTTGAYNIPARLPVTVHATVKGSKPFPVKSIRWEIRGVSRPFTFTVLNSNTYLSLEEDFLVDHGIYLVGLSACSNKNLCGVANLTIHAVPGVTLCELIAQPYVEYEQVEAKVMGCSIPTGRQPLTYQLYLDKGKVQFPITPPQTATTFNFFGPPITASKVTQFSVQVCDKNNICRLFPGSPVRVSETEVKEEDTLKMLDQAERYMRTNNKIAALSLYLTAALDPNAKMPKDVQQEMTEGAKEAIKNRYVNSGQLGLIYSAMMPILKSEKKETVTQAIAVMRRATLQTFAYQVKPPTSVLALAHSNAMDALTCPTTDAEMAEKVRGLIDTIVQCVAKNLPLGSRKFLESEGANQPSTLVFRKIIDKSPVTLTTSTPNGKVEATVVFENEVKKMYEKWNCAENKNCDGAVVSMTVYAGCAPYKNEYTRVSPIVNIDIRNPSTGKVRSESFEETSVRIAIMHTGNLTRAREIGNIYRCFYWDEKSKEWSQDGIMNMGIEGKFVLCWASHLSTFAVFEVYNGLSTSSIVGIVVAVLMAVFILGMFVFVFLRKKQAKNVRVSTEAIQPKRVKKMEGMERTVARVRTLTN